MENETDALMEEDTAFSNPDKTWKVLVVDDDEDMHEATRLVLEDMDFEGMPLTMLGACSADQAKKVLQKNGDIAVILLDVVMETDHAGLDLIRYIRHTLGNQAVQIILRTGYPGQSPERKIIRDFDIRGYWEKTDLTADKLFSLMIAALRDYKNFIALKNYSNRLKTEISLKRKTEAEKETVIENLKTALANIKKLSGMLPICSHCKKIKDENGCWHKLEKFIYEHSEADFSHGICPDCADELYGDEEWYRERKLKK